MAGGLDALVAVVQVVWRCCCSAACSPRSSSWTGLGTVMPRQLTQTRSRYERLEIPSYLGITEDAEPSMGMMYGEMVGVMDSCINFAPTGAGPLRESIYSAPKQSRIAVRGGSANKYGCNDGVIPTNFTSVLAINRYSQAGVAVVGHITGTSKHWCLQAAADFSSTSQRTDLSWNTATPRRPRIVELFEKLYVADATDIISNRQQLTSVDSGGVAKAVTADLGSGLEVFKPYCIEVFNNVLFASGQVAGIVQEPAVLWHSYLGTSPDVNIASGTGTEGWNALAYNFIGAKGEPIRAMKSGDNGMLIAKENQLYLLSGFGAAVAGWQYAVTPVDNTDAVGCMWPGALTFVEGSWYGIGNAGAWISDGQSVRNITPPRRRSWQNVVTLNQATVKFIPDRRCVAFGILNTGSTSIDTYWLYQIDRHVWIADWKPPIGSNDIIALPSAAFSGPTAPPVSITMTPASSTLTSVTGTVTLGDATAATEISIDAGGGLGYVVDQTLAPATTAFTSVTAIASSTQVQVRARHVKNGIYSNYCTNVSGYTKLATPAIVQVGPNQYNVVNLSVTQNANNRSLYVKRNGAFIKTDGSALTPPPPTYPTPLATGTYSIIDDNSSPLLTCGTVYTYTCYSEDLTWPAAIQQSAVATGTGTTDCSAPH